MTEQESKDLGTQMERMADSHVSSSKKMLGIDYDYSGQSLQVIDQALVLFHPEGFGMERTMHTFGAYVGETIRRLHGGTWFLETDGTGASLRGVAGKATIYPLIWMADRTESVKSSGSGEEIATKYASLLESLDLADQIPSAIPADHVGLPQGGLYPGLSDDKDEKTEAVATDSGDSKSEKLSDDEKANILAMAPACCFFLVAASDGNIDKKEAKAFVKDLEEQAQHSNPLIQTVFGAAPGRFTNDVAEISAMEGMAFLQLPLKLIMVRAVAKDAAPEMANEFCQTLYDMSVKIASASGGFLGFGNKIGKEERTALKLIKSALLGSEDE